MHFCNPKERPMITTRTSATQGAAKNGEIELARIAAAVIIVNFHSNLIPGCPLLFPGGYIAVDFFFLLSGFLMAASIKRKALPPSANWVETNGETAAFILRKLKGFFPEACVSSVIAMLLFAAFHWQQPAEIAKAWANTLVSDILLLRMALLCPAGLNGVSWYLSSLILCSAILYPLIRRCGTAPWMAAAALVLLGITCSLDASGRGLGGVVHCIGFTYKGNFRACGELLLGASLCPLANWLPALMERNLAFRLAGLVKLACYLVVLGYALHPSTAFSALVLAAAAIIITLGFAQGGRQGRLLRGKTVMALGRFSVPLFLSHAYWAYCMKFHLPADLPPAGKLLAYNACAVATALVVMLLAKAVRGIVARAFPPSCATE